MTFPRLSFQRKLLLVVLTATALGLAMASFGMALFERYNFRGDRSNELSLLANTLGANAAASMVFNDSTTAGDILQAVQVDRGIIAARLYDNRGRIFAEYLRTDLPQSFTIPQLQPEDVIFHSDSVVLTQAVSFHGETAGFIVLVSDLHSLDEKYLRYTRIASIVLLLALLATYFFSSRLLRLAIAPILHLSALAQRVTSEGDYSLRSHLAGSDEIGVLIYSFNDMLDAIQQRDCALQAANEELENRVAQRTSALEQEISDRKQAESELRWKTAFLEAQVNATLDGVLVVGPGRQILLLNQQLMDLWRLPPRIVEENRYRELLAHVLGIVKDPEQYRNRIEYLYDHPAEFSQDEVELVDGTVLDRHSAPVRGQDGHYYGRLWTFRDITPRKRAEEALLRGIIGMTDLALDTQITPEQREYLGTLKFSAESLLTVINDILDFSKVEAGKLELELRDFNLRNCVEATLKTLALRADEKRLELLCNIAANTPEFVQGDCARLRQILINLIGNAIKFTSGGQVQLEVALESFSGNDYTLHFTVSDTGIGIPAEKQSLIFRPFAQADSSTTRKYGGTGLGLSISSSLVALMGGRIWVESDPNAGSRFHFTAHFKLAAAPREVAAPVSFETLRGVRVLVVDDNYTNLRILHDMLSNWGMLPAVANDGEEALALLENARQQSVSFPLILVDLHMPGMDGFTLIEHIRRHSPSPSEIVMLTSSRQRDDAERCRALGVAAYLLKPIRH